MTDIPKNYEPEIKKQENETRLYKEWKEWLKQIEKKDNINEKKWEVLTKKLENVQNKIEKKFWDEWKEFFIRNMNDYLKANYQAEFKLVDRGGKKDIVLVLEWMDNKKLDDLVNKLVVNDNKVFVDENKDKKKEKGEKWIEIQKDKLIADEIFVAQKEIDKNKKSVWFKKLNNKEWNLTEKETKGGKVELINDHSYYEVWEHGDYVRAPIRLFTALSNEYFGWMSAKELSQKIPQLWVKKWKHGYEFAKLPKNWFQKVWNFNSPKWKKIVQPHSKIDLTSLQSALDVKKMKVAKESKEKMEWFAGWGRFYNGAKWEIWDIPDKWDNITYDGYAKDYNNLNGKQISIWARNKYDTNEKNNNFSIKTEINLDKGKKWFLVVGEWLDEATKKQVSKMKNPDDISKALQNKKVEAWFTTYEKWKNGKQKIIIKEVGDLKVHTVTETSGTIERWKDKNHPIYVSNNIYTFEWDINGSIQFKTSEKKSKAEQLKNKNGTEKEKISITSLNLNWKQVNLQDFAKDKNGEKKFNKIFPGWKGYLQLKNNHVVELSFDKKLWIKVTDLWERKVPSFDVWWVKIQQEWEKLSFDKKTGKIDFPKQIGWWKIAWKLEKQGDDLKINLSNTIAGHKIEIDNIKDKNVNTMLQKIQTSLLYLWSADKKGSDLLKWINFDKKSWLIKVDYKQLWTKDPELLLDKVKVDTSKISETFIMDAITTNVEKNYWKLDDKKETEKESKKTDTKSETKNDKVDTSKKTDIKDNKTKENDKSTSKQTEKESKKTDVKDNKAKEKKSKSLKKEDNKKEDETKPPNETQKVDKKSKNNDKVDTAKKADTKDNKDVNENVDKPEKIDRQKVKEEIKTEVINFSDWRLTWLEKLSNSETIPNDYSKRFDLLAYLECTTSLNLKILIKTDDENIIFPPYGEYKWEKVKISWNDLTVDKLKNIANKYPKDDLIAEQYDIS